MVVINSLYLDSEMLEDDLRNALKKAFRNKDIINYFGSEIYLIPMNVDFTPTTKLPAVFIEVEKSGTYTNAQEDIQVEPFSRFTVNVETYTNGDDKRRKNIKLAQLVESVLQSNQQLDNFYNRGLRLEQDRELSSIIDGVNRRMIRLTGLSDNEKKLILNKF